ncbi:MAG TPA: hypothetical protein VGL61_07730 [Kofleriaceae bacterium]|jgi:hypothetical protein
MSYAQPVSSRFYIGSLDDTSVSVSAQYNPKELTVDKQIPWSQHTKGNTDGLQWEFTGSQGRTMNVDLLFDGMEENESVASTVQTFEKLAAVRDPTSTLPEMRRPHHCIAVWGTVLTDPTAPRFQCVIMQVTVKYTMFSPDGNPLRATITLKLQEATRVSMATTDDGGASNLDTSNDQSGTGVDDGDSSAGDDGDDEDDS